MATTNEEIIEFVSHEGDRIIEQLTIVHDNHRVRTAAGTTEDRLMAIGVIVVAELAAIGLWEGGKFLWKKYNENNKKKETDG